MIELTCSIMTQLLQKPKRDRLRTGQMEAKIVTKRQKLLS